MYKYLGVVAVVLGMLWPSLGMTQEPETQVDAGVEQISAEDQASMDWARNLWESLDRKTGDVTLNQARVTLKVPENFYFLESADAEKILVDVWGNPPGQNVLGMLFPMGSTPFDGDAWAVTIEYEEDGYVSDKDAALIDYDDLLRDMQRDTREASKARVKQGYESVELVGWAAAPFYDAATNKLHWAKEVKFGDSKENTLNYNIRALGRKGVLVMNFIAGVDQLPVIQNEVDTVLAMASFDEGARYADFDPDVDKVAAYGIGALVAGKVLAKSGILAGLLLFLKKFGVFIIVGIGVFLKKLFSGNQGNR